MTRREAIARATIGSLSALSTIRRAHAAQQQAWPLWESYAQRFISRDGRVIDPHAGSNTTSEGQSYALFFALVAGDRARFHQVLKWTNQNLAGGQLGSQLPAWLWGKNDAGNLGVLDPNSASDSDLWIAYTLIQAGRLWRDSKLSETGRSLARTAGMREVRRMEGLGPMLLPGSEGFMPEPGVYQLNPSYLPLQVVSGLAEALPDSPWSRVARGTPALLKGASRHGFVLDWVAYWEQGGFRDAPLPRPVAKASYDAIRVYLWAGMLHPDAADRSEVLASMLGMNRFLEKHNQPPAEVLANGTVKDPRGSVGFSAALLPYLDALGNARALEVQRRRVQGFFVPAIGLYGESPRYYDQNLILFSLGWSEGRYSFEPNGELRLERL